MSKRAPKPKEPGLRRKIKRLAAKSRSETATLKERASDALYAEALRVLHSAIPERARRPRPLLICDRMVAECRTAPGGGRFVRLDVRLVNDDASTLRRLSSWAAAAAAWVADEKGRGK